MGKNFDEKRSQRPARTVEERTFTIGGVSLVQRDPRDVKPEALTPYEQITKESPLSTDLGAMDAIVVALLEPDSQQAWKELRARDKDVITPEDITDVLQYLIEQVTGRPTGQPSASGPGANGTEASSTATSSEPAGQAA